MKTAFLKPAIAFLGAGATTTFAASTGFTGAGSGILIWFLIGFAVLLVLLQVLPALVMFFALVKGLCSPTLTARQHKAER